MAEIESGKDLNLGTILSLRREMTRNDFSDAIAVLQDRIRRSRANINGPLVTVTHGTSLYNDTGYTDAELILPIDRPILLPGKDFSVVKDFSVRDAIKTVYTGNPDGMKHIYAELLAYLGQNGLRMQRVYTVYSSGLSSQSGDFRVDVYVSVS